MTPPWRRLLPLVVLLSGLAAPVAAKAPTFRVLNRTGLVATALYAVRSPRGTAEDWGRSLLPRPLPPEESFGLRATESAGCRFDLRLVLSDGRESRLTGQDVCVQAMVVLEAAVPGSGAAGALAKPPPAGIPGVPMPRPGGGGAAPSSGRISSGTGFVVARQRVLTNQHVVDGCRRITVRGTDGREMPASLQAAPDGRRDLAVLAVEGDPGPVLRFRASPAVRRGEEVVTYGFPLSGILSSGPTLTTGEVNALSGLRDNPLQFQISAPVQPGNSGGPLLDRQGNVLGVVVSKLNAAGIAARTGDIPQNVNFAVKGSEAVEYLRGAGVTPTMADSTGRDRSAAEVGELAHRSTVLVRCEK
jgi:S1-C subfamily serine protease